MFSQHIDAHSHIEITEVNHQQHFCSVIRDWHPRSPRTIGYCTTARFNEQSTLTPNDNLSYGSMFSQHIDAHPHIEITEVTINNILF